jgi:hypothetical protein
VSLIDVDILIYYSYNNELKCENLSVTLDGLLKMLYISLYNMRGEGKHDVMRRKFHVADGGKCTLYEAFLRARLTLSWQTSDREVLCIQRGYFH